MSDSTVSCPLTTMLYEPDGGFFLLSRHLARLETAAREIFSSQDVTLNMNRFTSELYKVINTLGTDVRQRARVVLTPHLEYHMTSTAIPEPSRHILLITLDVAPSTPPRRALPKSTDRGMYNLSRKRTNVDSSTRVGPFDVLMWNEDGQITETSIANFAVFLEGSDLARAVPHSYREGGAFVTPSVDAGLIAGIMRAELLEKGEILEGCIRKDDVLRYAREPERYPMICFNAVRGKYSVRLEVPCTVISSNHSGEPAILIETAFKKEDNLSALTPPNLFLNAVASTPTGSTPESTPGLTPISSLQSATPPILQLDALDALPILPTTTLRPFIWRRGAIIDCYDSYTNNLLQLFDQGDSLSNGFFSLSLASHVTVLRANQLSWPDFRTNVLPHLDFIILSPGPGSPHVPADIGVGGDLLLSIAEHPIPVLGVCLGHQALAALLGGKVIAAGELVHGRTVPVQHDGTGLFEGLPMDQTLAMVRYNSLTVDPLSLPDELQVIATNPMDNEIMGLKHKSLPLYGVQFHPESICSRRSAQNVDPGKIILRNFMHIVDDFWMSNGRPDRLPLPDHILRLGVVDLTDGGRSASPLVRQPSPGDRVPFKVVTHDLGPFITAFSRTQPDLVFSATSYSAQNPFFWLDSAAAASGDTYARFSYMGPTSLEHCIAYDLCTHAVSYGSGKSIALDEEDTFWHWMDRIQSDLARQTHVGAGPEGLRCGFVGYFGYEMKSGSLPGYDKPLEHGGPTTHAPDGQFMFAERLLAYDHWTQSWTVMGLVRQSDRPTETLLEREIGVRVGTTADEFSSWVESVKQSVGNIQPPTATESNADPLPLKFSFDSTPEAYKSAIKACQSHIADGNSYELCLTGLYTASSAESTLDYHSVYKHFRTQNPASHAAFISFPATRTTIMSCSPELFIRFDGVHGRQAAMKPIKGTLKRSQCQCGGLCKVPGCGSRKAECDAARFKVDKDRIAAFASDPKETAENLMIADLIRANLLEFCDASTVDVTKLFALETYENVYSLVSTITGTIPPPVGPVEGIRRCFPPGSMTGAPKLRSVQLLDALETSPRRGIYSGCLGFLSLDDRAVFSVVIRTLIAHQDRLSYGAGGAITWLSDPEGEWAEVVLKAQSVLKGRVAPAGEN